jgi:hypothetical protein
MPDEPSLKELAATVLRLEKKLAEFQKLLEELSKRIRLLQKTYPHITQPISGGAPVPRTVKLDVTVSSNKAAANTHEVAITDEAGNPVGGVDRVALVGFPGGISPGTATISAALMGTLPANEELVLVCRKVGGPSTLFVEHKIAITTGL